MQSPLFWLIVGIALFGIELITGTFYMLILGTAFLFAALGGWIGLNDYSQLMLAAGIGAGGVLVLYKHRQAELKRQLPESQSLDIGQTVRVLQWLDDTHARVAYRGTEWDAELLGGHPQAAVLYICDTRGSTLLLSEQRPEGSPNVRNPDRIARRRHHLRH